MISMQPFALNSTDHQIARRLTKHTKIPGLDFSVTFSGKVTLSCINPVPF
jgi:hypothetical protein